MHDTAELIWASETDHDVLADIMYDAVRHGPSRYTEEQREAWVPERRGGATWDRRLARQDIVMARVPDGPALGFMSLERVAISTLPISVPMRRGAASFARCARLSRPRHAPVASAGCGFTPA